MVKPKISEDEGIFAVRAWLREEYPTRMQLATAVRYTLQLLSERAPGNAVEVRVPPFGAVQCVQGPGHTRGTPPNVIETDADTWLALAVGKLAWRDAGLALRASGVRADVSVALPLLVVDPGRGGGAQVEE